AQVPFTGPARVDDVGLLVTAGAERVSVVDDARSRGVGRHLRELGAHRVDRAAGHSPARAGDGKGRVGELFARLTTHLVVQDEHAQIGRDRVEPAGVDDAGTR